MPSCVKTNIALAILLTCAISQVASATIRYVDAGATGSNNGSNWTNACNNPQSALSAASSGDEIWIADGTYMPDGGFIPVGGSLTAGSGSRTVSFGMKTGVEITGGFRGQSGDEGTNNNTTRPMDSQTGLPTLASILSGDIGTTSVATDNSYHVVTANGVENTALLDGFTIRDGYSRGFGGGSQAADRRGAGISVSGSNSSPQIVNCIIRDNDCTAGNGSGGGLFAEASNMFPGTLAITNCQFINNRASASGGGEWARFHSEGLLCHSSGRGAGRYGNRGNRR